MSDIYADQFGRCIVCGRRRGREPCNTQTHEAHDRMHDAAARDRAFDPTVNVHRNARGQFTAKEATA